MIGQIEEKVRMLGRAGINWQMGRKCEMQKD